MGELDSAVLHRCLRLKFPNVKSAKGNWLALEDGRKIFDGSGGASVLCIGHGDQRPIQAATQQMKDVAYCASVYFSTFACEELCRFLVDSTHGHMKRAYIVGSGSEAMESALKLARQYFLEKTAPEPRRTRFIARRQSYHGTTLGSLSVGGHVYRRAKFEPMLLTNISRVSPCYPYRGKHGNESDEQYVARLAEELDAEFRSLGPETVCAFIAEPVVGAALGCVPAVPGYFSAMKAVCDKYGALLILDEVMCGMGRTGTLHAWEQEDVVPDIQTLGKCLGGGYLPVAGVLANARVIGALEKGSAAFVHGHTYQGHAVTSAAALAVQRVIRDDNLLANVRAMGEILAQSLHERLDDHPHIGNIRGRGLFWGIEFVANKATREPFPVEAKVAMEICDLGLMPEYALALYPGAGTVDGIQGDHLIISPAYNVTKGEIEFIVSTIARLINEYFSLKHSPLKLAVGIDP